MKTVNRLGLNMQAIVAQILSDMSLKERSLIANMDEQSLPYLQYAFDIYISRAIGDDPQTGREVIKRVWQTLQQTHRIRLVSPRESP